MYTTESPAYTRPTPALIAARIKAAGRIREQHRAEADRAAARIVARKAYAADVLSTLLAEGAVKIGVKICTDSGKYRYAMDIPADDEGREFVLFSLGTTYGEDAEVWGIREDGSYCESVH